METEFSFRELYDVVLLATSPVTIKNRTVQPGEVIAYFDKISLANFEEIKKSVTAHGGFDDRALVIWDSTKEVDFTFTQGIFSHDQFGLMTNANLVSEKEETIEIHQREIVEVDEFRTITLKHCPLSDGFYVYNKTTGNKIDKPEPFTPEETLSGWKLELNEEPLEEVIVDYRFTHAGGTKMQIGKKLLNEFVTLEGKTKVQDDISGNFRTGIVKIPKLKLMSDLSIRLGKNAQPVVGTFKAIGVPVGARGNEKVMELLFLEDDIDSDM